MNIPQFLSLKIEFVYSCGCRQALQVEVPVGGCLYSGVVLTTAAGLTMIVLAATRSSSIASLTNVYSNTTVALGDVQRFTTQKVVVYQQPSNNEVNIPLTFYLYDGSCSSLPANRTW